jgi:hypothetical protein
MILHELLRGIADAEPRLTRGDASVLKEAADKLEQSAREHKAWEVLRNHPRWSLETAVTGRQWVVTGEFFPVSPPLSRADDPVDAVLAALESEEDGT